MRFSIIVGTYNQRETLPRTLMALKKQRFSDFEVHICDDGSDYQILPLIGVLKGRHKVSIHRQEHDGMRLAKNLNQGIMKAEGDYCAFVMGDSFPEPDWLETINRFVRPNTVISSYRVNVDRDGSFISNDWHFPVRDGLDEVLYPHDPRYPWQYMSGNGLVAPTAWLKAIGGWDEGYTGYGCDDLDLVMQAAAARMRCFMLRDAILKHEGESHVEDNPANIRRFQNRRRELWQ